MTSATELSLQGQIQITNASYLSFDMLTLLTDLKLVAFHTLVHLVKVMTLLVEVSVLLCQYRLMLLQEVAELVQFTLFQHLESVEGRSYFIRWRNLGHFCDGLVEQVMLTFDKCIVVPQHMLQLIHACASCGICVSYIISETRGEMLMCELVFTSLVKRTHMSNFLVNSLHELFQALEV